MTEERNARGSETSHRPDTEETASFKKGRNDDDLDLVDLGIAVLRRWRLILVVFLVVMALGIIKTILAVPRYSYSTVIEMSSWVNEEGRSISIEGAASATAKLTNAYIPHATRQVARSKGFPARHLRVTVTTETKGRRVRTITLTGKGPLAKESAYNQIETLAANELIRDSKDYIGRLRKALQSSLEQAEANMAVIKGSLKTGGRISRRGNGRSTLGISSDSLLILQMQAQQQQLNQLRERIDSLRLTRMVTPPIRSVIPAGLPRSIRLFLTLVAALFVSLLAAAFANYVAAIRRRISRGGP